MTTDCLILEECYIWWNAEKTQGKVIKIKRKTLHRIFIDFYFYDKLSNTLRELINSDVMNAYKVRYKNNKVDISPYTLNKEDVFDFGEAELL
tara:strand:+ start:941 stop:1216 length:276 start_codon:yes stop_codon:yes gene_type:complete